MGKKKDELATQSEAHIDELKLFEKVSGIIETRRYRAGVYANSEITLMYWEVGHYINSAVLDGSRAAYGKRIVTELASQLSWSHFIEILPIKSNDARLFYAKDSVERRLGTKELRRQISRKAFERREIANTQISDVSAIPFNVFKDPYLLDVLGLKDNFAEADLEKAILMELEKFIQKQSHDLLRE